MVEVVESYEDLTDYDKVATLDMGGTLVQKPDQVPTHARLNMAMGISREVEEDLYDSHVDENGDLQDHLEHAREQTELLRFRPEADISVYTETVQEMLHERELLPGAEDFIQGLKDQGYTTAVLSSAPNALTLPYADDLGIDSVYKWKDFHFTDEGLFDRVWVNPEATEGKYEVVEGLQENGVQVAHFGNGDNDSEAVQKADAGIRQWWQANPETAIDYALKEARTL